MNIARIHGSRRHLSIRIFGLRGSVLSVLSVLRSSLFCSESLVSSWESTVCDRAFCGKTAMG